MTGLAPTIHRFVVKIGSSVLTDERGRLLGERITQLAEQVAQCATPPRPSTRASLAIARDPSARIPRPMAEGRDAALSAVEGPRHAVIVSSGAIACGMAALGLRERPRPLAQLQACAAIGQGELMRLYMSAFAARGVLTAQVLLTQDDLAHRQRFRNAKQTLLTLLHRRVVPIVNENDTVAVEEITFGDNDRLAALVAVAVDAQLVIILSDVDGFLRAGKVVERVEGFDQADQAHLRPSSRRTTKGGMSSKLEAARIVGHSGIPMVLANGARSGVLGRILAGEPVGTLFVPPRNRLTSRKWWLAFALRQPRGAVVVDEGAAAALVEHGKSLLASGVREVRGSFDAGTFVAVTDQAGTELARGVCNFSSSELLRVRGLKSVEIARTLGVARGREVIHRDHLVLAKEWR